MRKILTIFITFILVAGIVSVAKAADVDSSSNDSLATAYSKDRHIVKSSNGTIVVLYSRQSSDIGLRGKRSTDGGATWKKLNGADGSTEIDPSGLSEFSICMDANDNIYVAYQEVQCIYFRKLTYNAGNWQVGAQKDVDINSYSCRNPSIIRDSDGKVWVAYGREGSEGQGDLRSAYATDPYSSWSYTDIFPYSYGTHDATEYEAALVIRNGYAFAVYNDRDIYDMLWSECNGTSWSTPDTITGDSVLSRDFSVTTIGSDVHLVYNKGSGPIYHKYYNGTDWSAGVTLSTVTPNIHVNLTTDDTDLWCFISEYYGASQANIKYKKRSGGTWDANWTAITIDNDYNGYSTTPLETTSYIPVVWMVREPDYEVKFDKSIVLNTAPTWTSVSVTPDPVKGGSTITITANGEADAESDTLAIYCDESPDPSSEDGHHDVGYATGFESPYNVYCTGTALTGDTTHTVYSRLYDGTEYSTQKQDTYTDDSTAPTSSATSPQYAKAVFTVNWSGSDPGGSGVKNYDVQYKVDAGAWTNWLTATTAESGNFGSGGVPVTLQSGKTYYFQTRARDNVGNVETYPGGNGDDNTIYDTDPPTSSATSPQYAKAVFTVNWSGDDTGGSGLLNYDVQYKVDAGAWTNWLTATTAESGNFGSGGVPVTLQSGKTYYFQTRARDNATNVEAYPGGDGDDNTIYDTDPPTSSATSPQYAKAVFTVNWSGDDTGGSGLLNYDVQYKVDAGGTWTDWLTQTTSTSAYFGSGGVPVTLVSGKTYYFQTRARDNATNVEAYPGGDGDDNTIYDTDPPTSSATSPQYAKTVFTVNWSGDDTGGSGLLNYDVQYKIDAGGTWTDWLTQTTSTSAYFGSGGVPVTLTSGKTYYFQTRARDNATNVEAYPGGDGDDNTIYDTDPPTSSATSPQYAKTVFTVNWSGDDTGGSGLLNYDVQYKIDAGAWTDWLTQTTSTSAYFGSGGDPVTLQSGKTYYFQTRARDNATNVETYPGGDGDDNTIYDTDPPTSSATSPTYASAPFTVNWSGDDTGGSGLLNYDVQYKVDAGGTWTDWLTQTTSTSAYFGSGGDPVTLVSGTTYYFQTRARDNATNVEAYPGGDGDDNTIYVVTNTYTWTDGAEDGDWTNSINWSGPAGYPDDADDKAVIDTSTRTINTPASALTIGELVLGGSYSGTLTLGGALTLDDSGGWDGDLTIGAGTTLYLSGKNLTLEASSTFSNSGTLKLQGGETLTDLTNDTDSGTVEYVGDGDTAADIYTLLDSGTTDYYHLTINSTDGATDTFRPDTTNLTVAGNFTLTAGTFTTNDGTTDRNLSVTGNVDIDGTFTANSSTITVSGNWDSSGGTFTYGTSTVDLKETGTVTVTSSWVGPFYNLTCAYPDKTTTLTAGMGIRGILTVQGGTLTTTGTPRIYLHKTPSTPISIVNGSTISVYRLQFRGTQNVPGYNYDSILTVWNNGTVTQGGDVTCTWLRVDGDSFADRSPTWNTAGYSLTINGSLLVGGTSGGSTGTHTFNANGSTITVSGNVTLNHLDAAKAILNLNTSNMSVAGNWTITNGSVNPGTSTVTFDGTGDSTLTGSTTFYVLVSTTSTKTVKVSSDTVIGVTNHLNFENITLRSTLDNATWYLNLQGTQDVSGVDVRDSNADDGYTILDFDCPDIEACYYGNNTNWDFGPPAAITDLTGLCDSGTGDVTLYWSTPGDDEWTGTLVNVPNESKYRIDHSSYSIQWSTNTFDVDIPTHSVTPHTQVSHTIAGLTGDTTWYFRIWTQDEVFRWSGLSNGATVWVGVVVGTNTYTWTGGGAYGVWADTDNWTGAAGYPDDANDKAVINLSSSENINTGAVLTIGELELSGSYSGTLTLGGDLTLDDSEGWDGNLTIGAGTLNTSASSYQINIDGDWSKTGGIFTSQSGTVDFTKSSSTQTLNSGGTGANNDFYNISHSGAGTLQLSTNDLEIDHNFTNSAGTFNASTRTVNFTSPTFTITAGTNSFHDVIFDSSWGDGTISGTLYVAGYLRSDRTDNTISGNIELNGSGDQTITGAGSYGTYGSLCGTNVTINKSGGSAILGAYMKIESLTINADNTFDVSESNHTLRIQLGNFTNNGTFNARSGTVQFADNTGTLTPGSSTFNNVSFTRSDGKITIVGTLYVGGNLTSGRAGTTSSNTISGNIQLNGSGDQTITATHANLTGFGEVTMTMDKSGGSAVLGSTVRIYNLTINADNTFNVAGNNLTVPSTFTNNGTLQLQGYEAVSAPTNNSGSTVEYTATSGSRAIKNWTYQSLKINGAGGTFTLGSEETLGENLTVSTGTFDLNGSTLTINRTMTIEAGAISQGSAGLTVLDGQATGTAVTVGADGTWSNTSTGNITLGAAVSNAGTITLDGDGEDPIIIASSDGATQRNWQGSGSFNITDVNVSSQTCTGGTPAKIYAVSSTDGGNNTNWVFLTSVRYWVGGAGNWSDAANHWSATSGGAAGATKPGTNDTAIFDVNSGTETCTINEAVNIKGLLMKNTYSGTITQGANTVAIGADNAVFSGGTFTGGSVDITINGNITISGTAFTSTSGTLYSKKTYTFSSGTFLHNDGTVDFQRTTNGPYYVITGETTFYNLTFSGNKYGWDISDNLVVENDLIITGTFSYTSPIIRATGAGTYTITVLGNVSHSGVAHMERDLTIIMDGTSAQTIGNSSTGYSGSLRISNTAATVSLSNNLKLTGSLTIDASTILDVTANDYNITIGRAWTRNGTFTQHQGTVDFKRTQLVGGDGYHVITGTTTFYNLTFSGNRYGWDISDDLVVGNDLIITGTFSYASPVIRATGAGAYTITVLGNVSHSGVVHMEDDLTIVMDGTSTQTIGTSNSGDIGSLKISNISGNDVDLSSALNLYTGSTCTIDASTALDLSGNALSVPSTFTNNGTLKLQGDESVSTPTNYSGSTVEYTATSGSRPIKDWDYKNLKINGAGGTFTLGTGETLDENLTISTGTFDLNGSTLTINGAATIEAGAISQGSAGLTVSDGQATGTAITVGADGTWSNTSTGNITLGAAVSNAGTITLDGDGADPIIIASSDGATQRNWQGSGSFNITDVNVSSQTCTGGTPAKIYAVSSTDGGNNTNWVFLTSVRYWVGGAGNWSDAANHWSATSGGAPGASKPGAGDTAIFDVNSGTETCTINEAVNIKGLLMKNTYSGTITQGANIVTIGNDNAVFSGGTFTGGSANITVNGSMTISGTAFTSTSGTLQISSTYTLSSGSFVHNSGTVTFTVGDATITPGADTFNNVTFSQTWGTINISGTLYVAGNLYSARTSGGISGAIQLNGSSDQTISGGSNAFNSTTMTINKSSGSAILGSNVRITNLTINNGNTFDVTTNNYTLYISNNFTNNGTFNARAGTIVFQGGNSAITPGTSTYNNVNFSQTWGTINISGTLYAEGNLYSARTSGGISGAIQLNGSSDQTISGGSYAFNSTTMTINKSSGSAILGASVRITTLIINADNTFNVAGYNLISTITNNGTLQLQGDESVSTPTNYSGSTVEYTATSGSRPIKDWDYKNLKINGAGGTFTLGTGETLDENLTISTGTFDLNGFALSISSATTIEAGAMKTSTNTVTFGNGTGDDSVSITGGELHIESDNTSSDIVLDLGSGSWSNTGGTIIYDGSTVNTDLLSSLSAYNNLTIDSAGSTYTLNGDITVNGDLTINDGTLNTDANNYAISVGGDWNRAGGTFTVNNSTVTFITASSTSTLTGSTTFYGLVSTVSGKNVKVSSDTVVDVTGYLNFENITLRSTLDNATWYLNLTGTQDVSGVDVRDSNASGGDTIIDFDCPDIEGCYYGNNTNWDFGPPAAITDLTGQCDSDTGDVTLYWSTPGDDKWTGVLSSTSEYRIDYSTDSSRQWDKDTYEVSIPTYGVTPHTEVSRTITGLQEDTTWYFQIWTADEIPNWSGLSNGATVWVTVIGTNTYTWTDGAEDGDWTNSNNWTGAAGYPSDADDKAVIDTSTRTINTPASALTIGELALGGSYSGTLTLGNNLTLDDSGAWNGNLTIGAGTLDVSGSNHQINIDGNWSNSGTGTFTAQSGTVTFYATASKTLSGTMTGTSAFYNLYFDSASGTWTLNNDLKVTNVLNINAGELNASNKTIELAGSGTPFLVSGTFTPSASTVQYTSPNDTNITAASYYHLDLIDPPLETRNQKPETSDQKELLQNLEILKIKETKPDKFSFKSLSGDLIEIGEERHSPPQPYLKLNRWDGEVSLKVDIPYAIDGQKSLVDNRLSWVNHRYDVDFYPKFPQEIIETIQGEDHIFRINEEGGVEFDVTLKERPESNVFTFPIEAQGLKFYYQPPLHPEHPTWADRDGDGKPDSFRPENVVGSYAVYHETQDKFFKTKEEAEKYKFGKAFHIYRPKIFDAEDNWVWGELNIKDNKLTVMIPQDFLDNAVYPVVIDPIFGYTTSGESNNAGQSNCFRGSVFTAPVDVSTATKITAWASNQISATSHFKGMIVLHSNLNIIADGVGGVATVNTDTTPVERDSVFSTAPSLTPNTEYVLGTICDTFMLRNHYDSGDTNQGHVCINNYTTPTDPTDASHNSNKYSIYCTYTAAEPGATYTLLSGTFDIDGNFTIGNSTDTMEVTADTNDPTIDLEGNFNITANSTFTASDTASFNVGGNWSNSGTFTHSTGTVTLDGSSGTQTVTSGGQSFYNLTINNTGTSVQLEDDLDVNGNLTISVGTLDTKSGENNPIYVAGNWTREGGTFECNSSTVTFDNASSTSTLTGSTTFYVLVSTATGKNVKVSSDTVIGVTNHLNFENITLRSTLNGATWYLNLSGSGTQDVSNVDVRDSNASGGDTIVAFGTNTDSGNNTNWDFGPPAAITDLAGQCDSDTGDVTLSWSTPGDDEWTGVLSSTSEYRIDYSTDSTKQWDKDDYEIQIPTHSIAPHTEASHTITGLTGDTTWYFRIWTADEVSRWSGLSNGATVWVNPVLSVSISTDTYNFGEFYSSTITVSGASIAVTNEGNVKETYSIKCSSFTTHWLLKDTPGNDEFTAQTAFHPSEPNNDDIDWESDDILTESLQQCTTAAFSIDNSQNGKNVPPFTSNIRDIWFRLKTPLSTSTTTQQNITVTISAEQGSP